MAMLLAPKMLRCHAVCGAAFGDEHNNDFYQRHLFTRVRVYCGVKEF